MKISVWYQSALVLGLQLDTKSTRSLTKMKFYYSTLVVALVLPALIMASHWKSPHLKFWKEAQEECADYLRLTDETVERYEKQGYPDEHSTHKLIHCILVTVNAWNEDSGVKDYVIKNFFYPSPSDTCYVNRTHECLCETVSPLPRHSQLKRAHKSFLCYYRNYGNIVSEGQFVPYSDEEREENFERTYATVDVPRCSLEEIAKGNALEVKEFPEIAFTYTVRTGFYEPEKGVHRDRVFTNFGIPEILSEKTSCCEASVRQQYCEEPARVFQTFKQCYASFLPTLGTAQEVAKELLEKPVPSPPCTSCGGPAPCKSCPHSIPRNHPRPCYNGQCY